MKLDLKSLTKLILEEKEKQDIFLKYQVLTEASLARVLGKYFDTGFIVISADRTCEAEKGSPCDAKELHQQALLNKQNEVEIRNDLRAAGFGFIPTLGGYRERVIDDQGNEKLIDNPTPEKSFVIPAVKSASHEIRDYQDLKELGITMSKKYNQDSFLYKPPNNVDKKAYYITKDGNVDMTFNHVSADNMQQIYFTKLRKKAKRRFTMTENKMPIYFIPKSPGSVAEARNRYGEIFIRLE